MQDSVAQAGCAHYGISTNDNLIFLQEFQHCGHQRIDFLRMLSKHEEIIETHRCTQTGIHLTKVEMRLILIAVGTSSRCFTNLLPMNSSISLLKPRTSPAWNRSLLPSNEVMSADCSGGSAAVINARALLNSYSWHSRMDCPVLSIPARPARPTICLKTCSIIHYCCEKQKAHTHYKTLLVLSDVQEVFTDER